MQYHLIHQERFLSFQFTSAKERPADLVCASYTHTHRVHIYGYEHSDFDVTIKI